MWTFYAPGTRTAKSARIRTLRMANDRESVIDELIKTGVPKPLNDAMDASRGGHLHWPRTGKDPRVEAGEAARSTLYPRRSDSDLSVRPGPPDADLPQAKVSRPLRRD